MNCILFYELHSFLWIAFLKLYFLIGCCWCIRILLIFKFYFYPLNLLKFLNSSNSFLSLLNFLWKELSSVQSLSHVQCFAFPWTVALQASLSIINSQSLLKLMSIESVMPSNHLILCCPLLLLPSIFPSIRVFFSESVLPIVWPKYWSFSFSISPSNEYSGLISFKIDWFDLLQSKGLSRVFSNTTSQKH